MGIGEYLECTSRSYFVLAFLSQELILPLVISIEVMNKPTESKALYNSRPIDRNAVCESAQWRAVIQGRVHALQ